MIAGDDLTDLQALAALGDNPDLACLEALLDRFNILEALGVVRHPRSLTSPTGHSPCQMRLDFFKLHGLHKSCRFFTVFAPPLLKGRT
jgi:hypothetical protein